MKKIPFDFVLDNLHTKRPYTKPMFGCTAVYIEDKIVVVLRKKPDHLQDNGVWIATDKTQHESLQKIFPNMRSIAVLGSAPTNWQILPEDSEDFEEAVNQLCELIHHADPRIGRVPKSRKPVSKKKKATKLA